MRDLVKELREARVGSRLPEDPWRYFVKAPGAFLVPVAKLDTIRFRPGNRAEKLMRGAYEGTEKKRELITVRKNGSRYTVVDGNSTVAVARNSGWKNIPATLG